MNFWRQFIVIRSYLAKVYFIKYDLIGVVYIPEACDECDGSDEHAGNPVVPFRLIRWLKFFIRVG